MHQELSSWIVFPNTWISYQINDTRRNCLQSFSLLQKFAYNRRQGERCLKTTLQEVVFIRIEERGNDALWITLQEVVFIKIEEERRNVPSYS